MKVTTKTIKGWANDSNLLFSPNTKKDTFQTNLSKYIKENLQGYKQINPSFESLRSKKATHKVIIKGWYWRGSWSDPTKEIYAIFYK